MDIVLETEEQFRVLFRIIDIKWSNMVNGILSVVEMALPETGKQYKSVKKNINQCIYATKNNVLDDINIGNNELEYNISIQLDNMYNNIYNIFVITFDDKERRDAIAMAVNAIINDIKTSLILEFNTLVK